MEMILQLILAGLNLRENQNGDKNDSDQNGEQMESKVHAWNVRDESVGQGIEALVRNNDGAGFLKGTAQQAAEINIPANVVTNAGTPTLVTNVP